MENSLSKITLVYQAAGIQNFSVDAESLKPTSGLSRKHKFFLAVNFTILVGECCAAIAKIYLEKHKQKQQPSSVSTGQILTFTVLSLTIILLAICMLNSIFLREKLKQILRNCKQIAELLSVLNQSADYSSFENEFKKTMVKLFSGFIASNTAVLIFIYQYNQTNLFLTAVFSVYPYFFLTTVFSYWTLLLRLIRENLRFVKNGLAHLHQKHTQYRINPAPYINELRIRRNQETFNFIVKLKRMYGIIYDSTSLVNELIGIPICVFLINVVISNITSGYKVILSFQGVVPVQHIAGKT